MIGFLILFLHVLVSPFKTQARLEAEIVLLRHQLSVLRQVALSPPRSCGRLSVRLSAIYPGRPGPLGARPGLAAVGGLGERYRLRRLQAGNLPRGVDVAIGAARVAETQGCQP
jgi:hypothetical protein